MPGLIVIAPNAPPRVPDIATQAPVAALDPVWRSGSTASACSVTASSVM